jgi:lambda family phage portal protein
MGGGAEGADNSLNWYLSNLANYVQDSRNISLDGVKIPHLFPGTKLNLQPAGQPGGVGSEYEVSLQRHIAAGLGLSYEEFSRDFSKTNYSSAQASMAVSRRFMATRKKVVADRTAETIYRLVVEEMIANGDLPLPPRKTRAWFYEPLVKDALCRATWIGAGRGQIDERKETEAAILRMESGLTTLEMECARLGIDFRDVIEQRAREKRMLQEKGLWIDPAPIPANGASQGSSAASGGATGEDDEDEEDI